MRTVIYVSGSRSDFGLMKNWLIWLNKDSRLRVVIAVTGTHLSKIHGASSLREIEKSGLKIVCKIPVLDTSKTNKNVLKCISKFLVKFSLCVSIIKPHFILVEGDRWESFAAALTGVVLNIPVAHISGGDVSKSVDDAFRHSITKMAHLHFPGTELSAERIKKMGEEQWRIKMIGTPINSSFRDYKTAELESKLNLPLKQFFIVLQHPVSSQVEKAGEQMRITLKAVLSFKKSTIIIYPNGDPGSEAMIREIEAVKRLHFVRVVKHIESDMFMSLLKKASVLIGNSSAGIVEALYFKLPVVNIGTRQLQREVGNNVISVDHSVNAIKDAIKKAISSDFRKKIKKEPYIYTEHPKELLDALTKIPINQRLLEKRMSY